MADFEQLETAGSTNSTALESPGEIKTSQPGGLNSYSTNDQYQPVKTESNEKQLVESGALEFPPLPELSATTALEALPKTAYSPNWPSFKRTPLWPCDESPANLFEFHTGNGSRVNLVAADLTSGSWQVCPAINEKPHPTSEKAEKDRVTAAINGGYFAPKGDSVSYVMINEKMVADPSTYKGFPKEYRSQILNRSELRILINKEHKTEFDIAPHDATVPDGYTLLHSLQAGPNLLRDGKFDQDALTREAFIRKDSQGKTIDVIRSSSPAARTAVGITADGHVLMVSVADKDHDKSSPGVTIKQLALLMSSLGCTKAINLDGGASTTMIARTRKEGVCEITMKPSTPVNSKQPQTWVKSILELRHVSH